MLELDSPCKVNLLLNILGKRQDGFHELESLMLPVRLCDGIRIEPRTEGVHLTCSDPQLPADASNLVHRAAADFLAAAQIRSGVAIQLEKRIPMAAGLGGGSGNAATTLLGLNQLFDHPLSQPQLLEIAARLGSDVPFFLQSNPAIASGRGEHIEALAPYAGLSDRALFLIRPGFGISTPWAYQELARFPVALNGTPGRALQLSQCLSSGKLSQAGALFYNSLEAPVLEKFPILSLYQKFLRGEGVLGTLMSGSGSTTFALLEDAASAQSLEQRFRKHFTECWTHVVKL